MEQTLPLSEMSTTPTKKLRVMRWVTFVLVLIFSLGLKFIIAIINNSIEVAIINNSIEVVETRMLVQSIMSFAGQFVQIASWLFLIYLSSNRAVRNAMTVIVASGCLSLVSYVVFMQGGWWIYCIFSIIDCLLFCYAYSIVIMNTNLSSIKKGWITVLCLGCICGFVASVTNLFVWYPNLQEILGIPDNYFIVFSSCLCFSNPMYKVLSLGYALFSVIAWYQIIFSDAFAYTGFKKDDEGVVYRYSFFNRYTVGVFISSAVVISSMCLLIAKGITF